MAKSSLYLCFLAILGSRSVLAQSKSKFPATPLISKKFASPTNLPYKVDTDLNLERGTQLGYNICNSTTEGQTSLCQTAYLNSVDDFCLWSAPTPGREVGDIEGEMVAWCTKPGKGTRLIPNGAITGVQFMKTSDYVQVVGFIEQGFINLIPKAYGGEMDPHGADLRGNPLGGVVFSNAWSGGDANRFIQAEEWHNFMGADAFCFKICDPSKKNAPRFCEHRFDRIGCEYNAPNALKKGEFLSCEGDVQDFPGTYTTNGQVMTYTQPPEEAGVIGSMPYTARVPASSNCVTYESAKLFSALASVTGSISGSVAPSTTAPPSTSQTGTATTTRSAAPSRSNGSSETLAISGATSFFGIIFAALFLS